MWTVPNIALLTECRLLSDSSAINMSLLRSEEQADTITFHLRHSPALRDFMMDHDPESPFRRGLDRSLFLFFFDGHEFCCSCEDACTPFGVQCL